jgi:hypothetical protein
MKTFKSILVSLSIFLAPVTYAEILEVFTWKAFPGEAQNLVKSMGQAAAIHTSLGAQVHAYQLDVGSPNQAFDYVLRWNDRQSWAATKEAATSSKEFANYWTKVSRNPSGELIASLEGINIDSTAQADSFKDYPVFRVFIWNPAPGKTLEVLENFAKAKKIHESLGAKVDSYVEGAGGTGNLHYLMNFKSWADLASFTDELEKSTAWRDFQLSVDPNISSLIRSHQGFKLF